MKKEKNKKFHFRLPKLTPLNLILMILIPIVIFFIIAIPVLYVNSYNANKVNVFSTQLEELDESARKDVIYGNKNKIEDFEFVLYCTNYDNESGTIKFQAFAYENEKTRNIVNLSKQISVRLGLYSDWIKCEATSSTYNKYIAPGAKNGTDSRSVFNFTISNVPKLPKKGTLPFINIKTIPLYAYITYTTSVNGTETNKRYILKYEYKDYVVGLNKLEDNRDINFNTSSSSLQWQYKNETTWTNLITLSELKALEVRNNNGHIEWKRKADKDTAWKQLVAHKDLSGYTENAVPEVRIEGSYIQYSFKKNDENQAIWSNYIMASNLTDRVNVRINEGYIQWSRYNQSNWINLKALTDLSGYTSEKEIEVTSNSSYIQWRFKDSTSYTNLISLTELIGVEARLENNIVQWKCLDETEWMDLYINNVLQTKDNLNKNEITYGPTAGGI